MDFELTEQDRRVRQLYEDVKRLAAENEKKAEEARRSDERAAKRAAADWTARTRGQRVKPKMTATEKRHYRELLQLVPEVMLDFRWPELARNYLPEEWRDIPANPIPDKTRITLRVDADVARFYRKLGPGYQKTMNDVLRTFMLARLVEILGIGAQPLELMMAQDTKQKTALEREGQLLRELEEVRRKRVGIG